MVSSNQDPVIVHITLPLLKNEIQPRVLEDLIGFIKQFMNQGTTHLVRREMLNEVCKMEGFYRREGGAKSY